MDTPTGSMTGNLQPGGGSGFAGLEHGTSDYQERPIVGNDIFVEESLSIASKDIDGNQNGVWIFQTALIRKSRWLDYV